MQGKKYSRFNGTLCKWQIMLYPLQFPTAESQASLVVQLVKNLPAMQEIPV